MRNRAPAAEVKVCGITELTDASLAAELGADYLGFIFYPKSPRALNLDAFRLLRNDLPPVKKVYVQVCPALNDLRVAAAEGFDFFQLHFMAGEDRSLIMKWADAVSPERLWLAPKIAPGDDFPWDIIDFAGSFLVDTYREGSFGGTGETGDWRLFREWSGAAPEKRWILAGGLSPENISLALEQTRARVVDVNSGVEERPGRKDHARVRQFFASIAEAR